MKHKPKKPPKQTPQQKAFYQYLYTKAGREHLKRIVAKVAREARAELIRELIYTR